MSLVVLCSFLLVRPEVCQKIACLAPGPWADLEGQEAREDPCRYRRSEVALVQASQGLDGLRKEVADTQGAVVQPVEVAALVGEAVVELEGGRTVHQANLLPWVHLP